jgi:hypothetical protein
MCTQAARANGGRVGERYDINSPRIAVQIADDTDHPSEDQRIMAALPLLSFLGTFAIGNR